MTANGWLRSAPVVLIPAYEPDHRLPHLVSTLLGRDRHACIVVVDDGSGRDYDTIFEMTELAGANVIRYPTNRGKGAALKSGFAWVLKHCPGRCVVCADCDGQHTPSDVVRVAAQVDEQHPIVLGVRRFTGEVPLRSRFGNEVTRVLFRSVTGVGLSDTQTGLRGYSPSALEWACQIPGDRFEYELSLLLEGAAEGRTVTEVEIETVYLDENASSHFRTFTDSARVYRPLLAHGFRRLGRAVRFSASSLIGFGIDTLALFVLHGLTGHLLASVIGARVISGAVNFSLNRRWVFGSRHVPIWPALGRYVALAAVILSVNYVMLSSLVSFGVGLGVAKILTEVSVVVISYLVQVGWVFARAQVRTPHRDRPRSQAMITPARISHHG